ncbi:MAG TPA: hypothetical protein DCG41_05790 [Verrucomicrobiales bacterium]|nr:hypothetical protein [Verrucomicrobiales bacterium]
MNEYLQSYIEPELEARIVACVLGEASAFEIGELERLMSERPELKSYQIGLEKIHGLLVEAHECQGKLEWQLSDEIRGEILTKINEKKSEEIIEKRRNRISIIAQRKLIYTLAACFFLTLVIVVLNQPRSSGDGRISILGGSELAPEEDELADGLKFSQESISSAPVATQGLPKNSLGLQRNMAEEAPEPKKLNASPSKEGFALNSDSNKKEDPVSEKRAFIESGENGQDALKSDNKDRPYVARAKVQDGLTRKMGSASAVLEERMAEPEVELLEVKVQSAPDENQSELIDATKNLEKKNPRERWGERIILPIIILLGLFLAWRLCRRRL